MFIVIGATDVLSYIGLVLLFNVIALLKCYIFSS